MEAFLLGGMWHTWRATNVNEKDQRKEKNKERKLKKSKPIKVRHWGSKIPYYFLLVEAEQPPF
jgi:hypothetical protein